MKERVIGRGGMGTVWLGRDTVLGRRVAMKRVGMVPGGSAPDLERAEREGRGSRPRSATPTWSPSTTSSPRARSTGW